MTISVRNERPKAPRRRLASTGRLGKTWRPSGTWVNPRRTTKFGVLPVTSSPSIVTEPAAGWTTPQTAFSSDDLPAPFAPISATRSPARGSAKRRRGRRPARSARRDRPPRRARSQRRRPQVRGDDLRVGANIRGGTVGDQRPRSRTTTRSASAPTNCMSCSTTHHRQTPGRERPESLDQMFLLGRAQPCRRLVEQQQGRPLRKRARDREQAQLTERQHGRRLRRPSVEPDERERLAGLACEPAAARATARASATCSRRIRCGSEHGLRPPHCRAR